MKTLDEIYNSIKDKFYNRTKIEIAEGSVIDNFTSGVSAAIHNAYVEIENAKNPHIYTKLQGTDIDSMGLLVGCARRADEDDDTYLNRMVSWNTSNQAANSTAIEAALTSMKYASNVTYEKYTQGVGTATAYIIPKSLDDATIQLAIQETKERISPVISTGSYIDYVVPELLPVRLVVYLSTERDADTVKLNIEKKVQDYINSIAPGDSLKVGTINKIGVSEQNVSYFTVSQIYINEKEHQSLSVTQALKSKFLFDEIIWNEVQV